MNVEMIISKAKVLKGRLHNLVIKYRKRMNWFDILRGLDTSDCVDLKDLPDIKSSPNVKYVGRYVPSDFPQIKDALGWLISHDKGVLDHSFIDFGSGKGRVLILAERMGFKQIIGIELSQKLCGICKQNLERVRSTRVQVFCEDATEYDIQGDAQTFYFCNPFEYCLLEKVLKNIQEFLRTKQWHGYIVYIDPRRFGRLPILEYELMFQYDGPGTPFHIYRTGTKGNG